MTDRMTRGTFLEIWPPVDPGRHSLEEVFTTDGQRESPMTGWRCFCGDEYKGPEAGLYWLEHVKKVEHEVLERERY